MGRMWAAYCAIKHKRLVRFYGTRLSMVLFIKMRKQIMRHGSLTARWKNYIRSDVTYATAIMHNPCCKRSSQLVLKLLDDNYQRNSLVGLGRRFHQHIWKIKSRFTDKIATREGKIQILIKYWDNLADEITMKV